jgi:SAM-dependent methyltransferase
MHLDLQKVCDIHDFFHPDIDRILRKELRSVPFGSRRAWEFAMNFRALQQKGKLTRDATGLGLGAGTEKLIYAIAPHVGRTVVTDLYEDAGGWEGVRTGDPKGLVVSKAPWPVDFDRIDVTTMDMRDIRFPDESFDFCWSSGSFEHIGHDEDYLRHLAEVDRVLRPGGVYAFTTAIVFGPKTLPIPHNYYFHPEHLVDLLHDSPLHAEPEFDCHVSDHLFNRPHIERFQDYGFPAGHQMSKPIVSYRRGVLLAANVMVLTKDPGRPKKRPRVVGFEESCRQVERHARNLLKHLWGDWQLLKPSFNGSQLVTQPQHFGDGQVALEIIAPPGGPSGSRITLRSRAIDEFHEWRRESSTAFGPDGSATIAFPADRNRIYAAAIGPVSEAQAHRVIIRARRTDCERRPGAVDSTFEDASMNGLRARLRLLRRAFSWRL